jgi:hypothetical protein
VTAFSSLQRPLSKQKERIMRKHAAPLFGALVLLLLGGPCLRAQTLDNDGCSDRTLRGDYTFTISGQIFHPDGSVDSRVGVAITHFNGAGYLSQDDFVMSSFLQGPVPSPDANPLTGFKTKETGTYTVNPDCTGNATIDFPNKFVIKLMFVVSVSGADIHTVVVSVTTPTETSAGTPIIHSDGHRQPAYFSEASSSNGAQGNHAAKVADKAKRAKKGQIRRVQG